MAITSSTSFLVNGPTSSLGHISIISSELTSNIKLNISSNITSTLGLIESIKTIESVGFTFLINPLNFSDSALVIKEASLEINQNFRLLELVHLTTNTSLAALDTLVDLIGLITTHKYKSHFLNLTLIEDSKLLYINGYCLTLPADTGVLTITGSLEAIDTFGPRLIDLVPLSGSTFNNPNTSVSFTLFDQEQTAINSGSVNIYIDNLQLISGGINVTPVLSGITGFESINNYTYNFNYQPFNSFSPDEAHTVSGTVSDTYLPPNASGFNYTFRVWKTDDIYGTINAVADTYSPYLINLNPALYQTGVLVNTNINIDIVDDHTGVDQNSVLLYLNNLLIVSGESLLNQTDYPTTVSSISGGKGYSYFIEPAYDFGFNTAIPIQVYAQDKYTYSPNILDTNYYFVTFDSTYLTTSGFEIYSASQWTLIQNLISYEIQQSGVDFRVHYVNTSGTGIDLTDSKVLYNGVEVSGIFFTEIIPGYDYLVNFNLVPDYATDCDLIFHIVESGTLSGIDVYYDYHNGLLWGAEYCYNPDPNFEYTTDIPVFLQIYDKGDWPLLETLYYRFTTTPMPKNELGASIVGVEDNYALLGANLTSHNPFFEYGKEMELEISASDYAGNTMVYKWKFRIEEN